MSKINKLPSGKFQIRWIDHAGRRRSESYNTKSQAESARAKRKTETDNVRSGRTLPHSRDTVSTVAAEWLKSRPPRRKLDNTVHLKRHILPFMGETTLAQVTAELLEKFVRELEGKNTSRKGEKNEAKRKLAPSSIKNILITLGKLMGDAGHPIKVKYKVPTSGYSWIEDAAEVVRFLGKCGDDWFRIAAELAVYGGLRKGEVAGLRRSAIDFDRGLIRIDRSYNGPTKSRHVRWVPLAPALASRLKPWLLANPGQLVVTMDGKAITEKTDVAKRTRRACKRAGVGSVNFHQLRHTAASHLALRVPLPMMGAILGHASPITTARYAHLNTESIGRDTRMHLDFAAPAGKVVELHPSGNTVATGESGSELTTGADAGI